MPPVGEACVCVCVCAPCSHRDSFELASTIFIAGGCRAQWKLHPTKLSTMCWKQSLISSVYLLILTFAELCRKVQMHLQM